MHDVLKLIYSLVLFYCISFCGHEYWSSRNTSIGKTVMYCILIWFGLYAFVQVNH